MDDFYGINHSANFATCIPAIIFLGGSALPADIICLCDGLGLEYQNHTVCQNIREPVRFPFLFYSWLLV